jgi:predicted  nucleic acid-binding Zn-ribbon protein
MRSGDAVTEAERRAAEAEKALDELREAQAPGREGIAGRRDGIVSEREHALAAREAAAAAVAAELLGRYERIRRPCASACSAYSARRAFSSYRNLRGRIRSVAR